MFPPLKQVETDIPLKEYRHLPLFLPILDQSEKSSSILWKLSNYCLSLPTVQQLIEQILGNYQNYAHEQV